MEICKHYIEDLKIGMFAEKSFLVAEEDVKKFSEVSGDINPLHLDENYAAHTIFKNRVAHGALIAAYISSVLGNDLPGPGAIFVDMNVRFRRPVYLGDVVRAHVEVDEIKHRHERVIMKVCACVNEKKVVTGTTTVRIPRRKQKADPSEPVPRRKQKADPSEPVSHTSQTLPLSENLNKKNV